jgi:hypothetical protein
MNATPPLLLARGQANAVVLFSRNPADPVLLDTSTAVQMLKG